MFILNQTKWIYVTTMAENHELPQAEHAIFLTKAKGNDVCVQYSMSESDNSSEIPLAYIRTPGIIVFTSSLVDFGQKLKKLPPKHGVIIITHDRTELSLNLTNKVLILSDGFAQSNFSNYLIKQLSNSANISENLKDYFVFRHDCSWNASSDELSCARPSVLTDYLLTRSSEYDINAALHAMDIIAKNRSFENGLPDNHQVSLSSFENGRLLKVKFDIHPRVLM